MAHLSSIGAAIFTDLAVAIGPTSNGVAAAALPATMDAAGFHALFNTSSTSDLNYMQILNVREFPAVGAQPNIVNVPVYGQRTAQSIGGQSDPPSLEITVNYVGTEWAKGVTSTIWTNNIVSSKGNELANMVSDGVKRAWRLALMQAAPTGAALGAAQSQFDSNAGGIGKVENSIYYFLGKLESLLVTPSLTDATTATLSFSVQSDFYGAYTV